MLTPAPEKRQSLIPFPRTGKRSGGERVRSESADTKELNQVYIYNNSVNDHEEDDDELEALEESQSEPEPLTLEESEPISLEESLDSDYEQYNEESLGEGT